MSRNWRAICLALMAGSMLTPLGGGAAHATGCDTNPADASSVVWTSGRILAPNGSLAKSTSAAATVTAYNSSGVCVQGAQVSMQLRGVPGGGTVTTSTNGCAYGSVGPNVSVCTTDGNGSIPIWYSTPASLPNDGTDYVDASLNASAALSTSYTYGSFFATASQISATEGQPFSGTVAVARLYNFATVPAVTATITWGDGTTSAGTVSGPPPGSPGPTAGTSTSLTISGTHTFAEESANATPVVVTLSAPTTVTLTANDSATIADAPITATGGPTRTVKRRTTSTFTLATFTDADPAGAVGDYTATISWGDGTQTATGSISATAASFAVTASHNYATNGTWSPVATITDSGGATARATTTVNVTSSGH